MQKLLVICGPTAVGKTGLAVNLAKKFGGEIVSADSRQVYKGMDIGTGKDLPENAKFQISNVKWKDKKLSYYLFDGIPVWMLDVVEPTQQFSVAQYSEMAARVISEVWERSRLPILVGGTGLYIKALVDGIETSHIPPDAELRKEYGGKSAVELLSMLEMISPQKARLMNESDRKNPRRLIRAIEIADWKLEVGSENVDNEVGNGMDILTLGLTASPEVLKRKIEERINKWIKSGSEGEVRKLLDAGVSWNSQAMKAIGYRQWKPYFDGNLSLDEVITNWKKDEWQYAKRQLTWFKKDKRIFWANITKSNWYNKVEDRVKRWYNN